MLEDLRTARAAYFYRRRKPLTNKAVTDLFVQLRKVAVEPGQAHFRVVRAKRADARYSAICFAYDRPVSFLDNGATDRVHGFLLIVECAETIAVFKAGLDVTSAFRRDFLDPLGRSRVERAIGRHDAVFENGWRARCRAQGLHRDVVAEPGGRRGSVRAHRRRAVGPAELRTAVLDPDGVLLCLRRNWCGRLCHLPAVKISCHFLFGGVRAHCCRNLVCDPRSGCVGQVILTPSSLDLSPPVWFSPR